MHLASHYYVYPRQPDFTTNSMDFGLVNVLDVDISEWTAYDIIKTMLIYNRRELTEDTELESSKIRPSTIKGKKNGKQPVVDFDIDFDIESERATLTR